MIQAMQPDAGIAVVPFIFCAFLPETLPRRTFTSSGWSSTPWVLGRLYFLPTLPRAMPWARSFWAFSPTSAAII